MAEVFGGTFGLPTNPPPPTRHSPAALSAEVGTVAAGSARSPPALSAEASAVAAGPAALGVGEIGSRSGGVGGRTDIVQALQLGDRDRLVTFCEAVQLFSPVSAYIRPGENTFGVFSFLFCFVLFFCSRTAWVE